MFIVLAECVNITSVTVIIQCRQSEPMTIKRSNNISVWYG